MKKHFYFSRIVSLFIVSFYIITFHNTAIALEYSGIGGRPAYPRPENPRTDSIFVHTLSPGTTQQEGIRVINNTEEIKTLTVHAVDSLVSSGGAFACRQESEDKEGVGAWITLEKQEITLEPMTSEVIPFVITVPANVEVGEQDGCIVIQEKKEKQENQSGMGISFRTGLRVSITIPGKVIRELEAVNFISSAKNNGNYLLTPSVKNKGNVSIDTDITVITKSIFGIPYFEHKGNYPVMKGQTSEWNFELEAPFWGGWYTSTFFAEYDKSQQATTGIQSGGTLTKVQGPTIVFFTFPSPLGLAIEVGIFLFIVFVFFLFILAKKRKKWITKEWKDYKVQKNDNIKSVAEAFTVSWKLLAEANKIKAPYELLQGSMIKVPPKLEKKEKKKKVTKKPVKKKKNEKNTIRKKIVKKKEEKKTIKNMKKALKSSPLKKKSALTKKKKSARL